jgi:MFS family permease
MKTGLKDLFLELKELPNSLKKFVGLFSLMYFVYYFNFFWLIQNVYILNHGINFTNLSIILAIWSACILVLEIPSGILADKVGKKSTVVFAKLAYSIGIIIFALVPNLWGFVIGVIAFGINESFMSGAQESLLYDNLKDFGKEKLFGKILAIATTIREFGLGSGVLIAGFITQVDVRYNLIGSVILAVLGVLIAILLNEGRSHSKSEEIRMIEHFKDSVRVIFSNSKLTRIILFSITVISAYLMISEYFVPSLDKLGVSYIYIGIFAALEAIFFSLGSFVSQKISRFDPKIVYLILSAIMGIFLLVISSASLWLVIIGFMVLRIVKAISEIFSMADWQKYVSNDQRATTISINSFSENIIYIFFGIAFGNMADKYGLFRGFYLAAALAFSYLGFMFILNTVKRRRDELTNV